MKVAVSGGGFIVDISGATGSELDALVAAGCIIQNKDNIKPDVSGEKLAFSVSVLIPVGNKNATTTALKSLGIIE